MNSGSNSEQAIHRWLTDQFNALILDLAETLDLEAGLHDAMIPARHVGLVDELRNVLDIESGLGAIVRDSTQDTPGSTAETTINLSEITQLHDLVERLSSQNPRDRLEFRTHSARRSDLRSYACGCVYLCVFALDLTSHAIDRIEQALSNNRDHSFGTTRAVAVARTLIRDLTALTDRTTTLDQGFDASLQRTRKTVDELVRVLDVGGALEAGGELARSLAEDLDGLDGALNDFAGMDLRNIDLEGMRLEGLRWSSETQWPPAWFERIKETSIEIGPGLYEVRSQ